MKKMPLLNRPQIAVIVFWLFVAVNIVWALLSLHTLKFFWTYILIIACVVALFWGISQFIYELFE